MFYPSTDHAKWYFAMTTTLQCSNKKTTTLTFGNRPNLVESFFFLNQFSRFFDQCKKLHFLCTALQYLMQNIIIHWCLHETAESTLQENSHHTFRLWHKLMLINYSICNSERILQIGLDLTGVITTNAPFQTWRCHMMILSVHIFAR